MNNNEEFNYEYKENMYTENAYDSNAEVDKKENTLFGVVGAFLGTLIGVALWVVIYNLGYIAAISGLVMIACGMKGYELLSGGLSKKGIIITIIITAIMVYVATHLSYGISLYKEVSMYGVSVFEAINSIPSFLADYPEIRSSFIKDLLMGYAFTFLGAFSSIRKSLSR